MPTYDYTCDACKHAWEVFQSMNDKPARKCPKCRKLKARRLIGAGAGLIFKGSGFYTTDYKKTAAPVKESGATAKDATSEKTTTASSDSSAPATKKTEETKTKK